MQGLMMDYPLTIDRILERANRMFPRKQVITMQPDGEMHRYGYADLYERTKRLSKSLLALGIQPGDRVATFAWNHYQHLELYFAIPGAGAVCHTLNIRLFADQLAYIVNHAEDRIVFIDAALLPLLERVADQINCVEHYVLIDGSPDTRTALPNVVQYEDLINDSDDDFEWRCKDETQAMGLCYTSGTTGNPKGALYSHRSMFLHTLGIGAASSLAVRETDIVMPVVPQFHAMAWGLPYACPMVGASLVMPGPHLKPKPMADLITNEKVTIAAGVPSLWTALYQELAHNPRDLSRLRSLVVGGSAMPRALTQAYEENLGVSVLHAWGMTELSPLGTVSRLLGKHEALSKEEQWDVKASQGYAVPGVEMRIVGDDGTELDWDGKQMGELQVRGPWIIRQYFKMEVSDDYMTRDGWFRTGDVVTIDRDGFMRITDRTHDLVKSGGEWISSVELENHLMAHPDVLEAAVIAVPDEKWSERPFAVVVAKDQDKDLTCPELAEFLAPRVAKFWIPEGMAFVREIPKTSVGKFSKKTLRKMHADGELTN